MFIKHHNRRVCFHLKMPQLRKKPNAVLDDDEIIQEVLGCKSAESDSDTDDDNNTSIEKISIKEGEEAVVRRIINQITLHRMSLLRQSSIKHFLH